MSRIVVIEEDQLMRALLVEWLTAEGYAVDTALDGVDDVTDAADLIIVDVLRPRRDGAGRVRAIKDAHPGTPLIAMSGQFCPGPLGASTIAEILGVRQVIAKPFTRRDLLSAVHGVIGSPH